MRARRYMRLFFVVVSCHVTDECSIQVQYYVHIFFRFFIKEYTRHNENKPLGAWKYVLIFSRNCRVRAQKLSEFVILVVGDLADNQYGPGVRKLYTGDCVLKLSNNKSR